MTVFNIKEDLKKPCYCHACLDGKPVIEQSPDPRYCQGCYEFLLDEAKLVTRWKIPDWVPKTSSEQLAKPVQRVLERDKSGENGDIPTLKLSTLSGRPMSYKKRALPEDLIERLNKHGLGSKAIATKLKARGIVVSYKTIQRLLNGQRQELEGLR
ncbi:hypothetical protein ACFLRP_00195 [Bacteroidota bacterium]